jgi:hypothetical protein
VLDTGQLNLSYFITLAQTMATTVAPFVLFFSFNPLYLVQDGNFVHAIPLCNLEASVSAPPLSHPMCALSLFANISLVFSYLSDTYLPHIHTSSAINLNM